MFVKPSDKQFQKKFRVLSDVPSLSRSKCIIDEIIGRPTLADATANTIQYTSLFLKTQVHALRDFANETT